MFDFEPDNATVEALRHLLHHDAWQHFFVPKLRDFRGAAVLTLLKPHTQRSDYPDDFLRGQISAIDALLAEGQATLDAYDDAQRRQIEEDSVSEDYETRAHLGHVAPLSEAPTAERNP